MEKSTENTTLSIDEIFEISEVEKGDVSSVVLRQGCISVQTPNTETTEE